MSFVSYGLTGAIRNDKHCQLSVLVLCSYAIKKKDEIERVAKANR